jgi:hypothetical protein
MRLLPIIDSFPNRAFQIPSKIILEEIVKGQKSASIVIPAKAGIQFFQFLMDAGMAKSGLFTIPSF